RHRAYNRWSSTSVPDATRLVMGPVRAVMTALRGIAAAVRRRPLPALAVVVGVFALHVLLPPLLLAVTRKPWTYFAFNPWLKRLPEYLASSTPLSEKLDFLTRVALFWFTADRAGAPSGASPWTPWTWRAFWRCRSCSAPTSCWCSTAALGGEWRGGGQAGAAPAAASWADSRACWDSRPGRAAWWGAGRRCSRSSVWFSPGFRAVPSPCSPVSRAS